MKYKYSHLDKSPVFVKFGLQITGNQRDGIEIENHILKKECICRLENPVDYFYYFHQSSNEESFEPCKLVYVDDNFIKNTKLYINLRPIYSSSGKTQLNQPNIFEFLSSNELEQLNHIIMNDDKDNFIESIMNKYCFCKNIELETIFDKLTEDYNNLTKEIDKLETKMNLSYLQQFWRFITLKLK